MMLNLATALAGGGHADCLVAAHGDGPMFSAPVPRRCRFLRIGADIPWYIHLPDGGDQRAHVREESRTADELAAGLRDWGAELLVVNTLTNLTGILAAAHLNIPAVTWVHGIIDPHLVPVDGTRFKSGCDEVVLRSAERVVGPSEWTAAHFEARYGLPMRVIPNATMIPDTVAPPPDDGLTRFCCLNTWDPHKGLFTLLEAAFLLKQHTDRFRIDLYGDGSEEIKVALRAKIDALKLGDVVRMNGRTSNAGEVYTRAHALVTAADIEPFGMTLIEAMSYARPVIVSDTSGHREIVTGPFGVRVPASDPAAFAWQMHKMIALPARARRMGELGRQVVRERYGFDQLAASFAGLFREVLDAERAGSPASFAHRYGRCRPYIALAS